MFCYLCERNGRLMTVVEVNYLTCSTFTKVNQYFGQE